MTAASSPGRGRPPAASREMLQDAAFELFLEQGYAGTTVEHVTRRAGVSRNTFFNYFAAKGDVFWVELDAALDRLDSMLAATTPDHGTALDAVREAVRALGAEFGPARVPFALTQHRLIGSVHELQASAVTRFTRGAGSIRTFLLRHGETDARAQAIAYAVLGAMMAAAQAWAAAGSARGTLEPYLESATDPVFAGFRSAGGPSATMG